MGIQSTIKITRDEAIDRINLINQFISNEDYVGLEENCFEPEEINTVEEFVKMTAVKDVELWTNRMLERLMDWPFYRESIFYNYRVV